MLILATLAAVAAGVACLAPSPRYLPASLCFLSAVAAAVSLASRRAKDDLLARAESARQAEIQAEALRAKIEDSSREAAEARSSAARAGAALEADLAQARARVWSALRCLGFARAVLAKVPAKTEDATFALMGRLVALRDESSQAAHAALESEGDRASIEHVNSIAAEAGSSIKSMRQSLAAMRIRDKEAAKELASLGQELKSGMELLTGIEEITERSRLIAFNMAVEAARIGEKGLGFKVIVNELRALNDRTVEFSHRVAGLLERFKRYTESLIKTAVENTAQVTDNVERGIREEELAIESLLKSSSSCVDLSVSVSGAVSSINRDLDGILESLQFQDITRQMIEGAMATMSDAELEIAALAPKPVDGDARLEDRRAIEELRAKLLARAKTRGEKEAIQEVKA